MSFVVQPRARSAAQVTSEPAHVPIAPRTRQPLRHEHTTTISRRAANDPRQHARQRRAVARGVVLAVPLGFGRTREARCPSLAGSSPKILRARENTATVWSATDG